MGFFGNRVFHIDFDNKQDHALGYLFGMLKDTRTTTLLTVQRLSVLELDWQYETGWNTIGALLSHIVAIERYFRIVYVERRELTELENVELTPALDMGVHIPTLIRGKHIDHYIHELTASREELMDSLRQVKFEDFRKTFQSKDYTSKCNLAWLLFHMIEDEIYHRGQISMIKKLFSNIQPTI